MTRIASSGSQQDARQYRSTSFWLESTPDDLAPRRSSSGDLTVDVAILGGGFSGLWTAYHLLREEPSLTIALLERDIVGFGASGRNGGWCSPRFPVDPRPLIARFGLERARETILSLQRSVEEIGHVLALEDIDAHYHAGGLFNVAIGERQVPALQGAYSVYEQLGLADQNQLLGADEARDYIAIDRIAGAMRTKVGASVHPGNLVRGLARAIERRGGVIFEQTPVTAFEPGAQPKLVTDSGTITAQKAVVIAAEAGLPKLPQFRRDVLPMSSMIVLTEPLSKDTWDAIGWAGSENLSSQSHLKNYLTRTRDGRILYGSRGAAYSFGSETPDRTPDSERTYAWMRQCLRNWFPILSDVAFTHAWGGYLGVPRDWMPTVAFDRDANVGRLHGYTGRGVSTSYMAGRLLAGQICGKATGLESLPMHRQQTPKWEPEPFRWLGVRYVQNAFGRIDRAEQEGRSPPIDTALAEYLGDQ